MLSDEELNMLQKFFYSCGLAKAYIYIGNNSNGRNIDYVTIPVEGDADYIVST